MKAAQPNIFGYLFLLTACLVVFTSSISYSSEARATSDPSAAAAQYPPGSGGSDAGYGDETAADKLVSNGTGEDEVVDAAFGNASEAVQVIGSNDGKQDATTRVLSPRSLQSFRNNDEEQDATVASSTRRYDSQTPPKNIQDRETSVFDSRVPRSTVITELPDTGGLNPSLILLATVLSFLSAGIIVAIRNFIPED